MAIIKIKLEKDFDNYGNKISKGEIIEINDKYLDKYISEGIGTLLVKKEAKQKKKVTKELKIDSKETKDETK